jgi:3-oxoacyl-[acyl-carrier protein] reductase
MDTFSLAGRTALVTGSSRGLGLAMAMALGRAGARVALNFANNQDTAAKGFARFASEGLEGAMFRADVTDAGEVDRMCAEVKDQLGPIDILIPNATCEQPLKPIEEYDWAFYQAMLDFFVKSPFLLTRACLPDMKRRGFGRIINITSEVFERGTAPFTAYVAAKGGQNGFSRSLASELAPHGITVNMIAPGWIPVERHEDDPQEDKDAYLATIPMGRWGVPEDICGAAVFLAGEAASFLTGQNLVINGGISVG